MNKPGVPDVRVAAVVRFAERTYTWLTRLLPKALYRDFGSEMVADFGVLARRAHADGGAWRVLGTWRSAVLDVVRRGVTEWWVERFARRPGVLRAVRAERVKIGDEMLNWLQEFRLAARALAQRPSFTLTVVVTLALGLGATVAIFAIVNSVLIRPLPYPESERIVWIRHHAPGLELPDLENSPGTLQLYREHARSFSALAAMIPRQRNLTGGRQPARVPVLEATPALFAVLQVQPQLGRPLVEADSRPGAAPVAVLTHSGWSAYFGASGDIIGRNIKLNGVSTEVVGVMPESFVFPEPETAALLPMPDDAEPIFGAFGVGAMARLAPGASLASAQTELSALQSRISELFPDVTADFLKQAGWSVSVHTMHETTVEDARTALWIVLATVGFLLLVACASVANLFLVRAEARQREIGIRMALGALRMRIAATYLYESLLVGLAGGLWGTVAALFAVRALVAAGPAQLPRLDEISLDATVIGFAALVSIGAGLLFGVLPLARQMAQPLAGLVGTSRGHTAGRERQRVRKALIVTQIALALMLLTGSGLMLRSFQRLRAVEPGFDADGVITMGISFGDDRSKTEVGLLMREILDQVRAIPGVISAGGTNALPLDGSANNNGSSFAIQSRPRAEDALPPVSMYAIVTDGFHETMRSRIVAGRALQRSDEENERRVMLVNETFARSFLDGKAVGERISFGGQADTAWNEIVGVVADIRSFGLREEVRPHAYLPITTPVSGARPPVMNLAARTAGDPSALAPLLRNIVQRVHAEIPLTSERTMQSIVDEALAQTSFTMMILSVAALVAMLLGAVGLYGVIGYVVSQRTKEIGVRIALGAVPVSVRRMVLRQGLVLAVVGTAIGLGGAALLSRFLDSLLFEVDNRDPLTFVAVSTVLLAISALAAYVPARRASAISPLEALRGE